MSSRKKKPEPVFRTTTERDFRDLPVEFKPEELVSMGRELAVKTRQLRELEEEKASVVSDYGARISMLKKESRKLSRQITDGQDVESVECRKEISFTDDKVRWVRIDTEEVVETREITDSERQTSIETLEEP